MQGGALFLLARPVGPSNKVATVIHALFTLIGPTVTAILLPTMAPTFFYRATLCVSAVLGYNSCRPVSVCRFICLSHSRTVFKRLKHHPKSSCFIGHSTFLRPSGITQFQGELLHSFSGGVKYTGVGKNWRFSTEIAVYLGFKPTVAIEG